METTPVLAPSEIPFEVTTFADVELQRIKQPRLFRDDNELVSGRKYAPPVIALRRSIDGVPVTLGPARADYATPGWHTHEGLFLDPGANTPLLMSDAKMAEVRQADAKKRPVLKTGASGLLPIVESNLDWSGTYYAHHGPIKPEYELLEPFTLYDVEVYVQQAINRRLSLMFRNGYRITGNNKNKVDYITRRLNQIAYLMKKTWANTMREILTTLSLCSNCFLLKLRQEDASGGKASKKNKNRVPIAAYVMVPPQSLYPWVEKGKITKWRRFYNWSAKPWEDYAPEDVIHLTWNRKPGHIFGTPRTQAVRDDIFAIRRLEENIELLFINFLFPLFHVKIGTKDAPVSYTPGGASELDTTRRLIETMPKEGVFVTDERVDVKVVGATGSALDPVPSLAHYKKRIFTGLGMSSMDMGEGDTTNGSTADNVSQALKDSIKYDLDVFTGQISMEIFRDLFEEANFSLSIQDSLTEITLEFQEIDMDNKVKEENHATNLYNSNGLTHDEFRGALKRNPLSEEEQKQTHHTREVVGLAKEQGNIAIKVAKAAPKPASGKNEKKPGGKKGKSGRKASVTKTAAPRAKATQNISTPTNQHGTNNSPKKAKSSSERVSLYSYLQDTLESAQMLDDTPRWPLLSARVIDRFFSSDIQAKGSSYTKHHRMQIDQLKEQVGRTVNLDELFDLVSGQDSDSGSQAPGDPHEHAADRNQGESRPEDALGSGDSQSEHPAR